MYLIPSPSITPELDSFFKDHIEFHRYPRSQHSESLEQKSKKKRRFLKNDICTPLEDERNSNHEVTLDIEKLK